MCSGGPVVAENDSEPFLTEVRLVRMVNEAPKTIREILEWGLTWVDDHVARWEEAG